MCRFVRVLLVVASIVAPSLPTVAQQVERPGAGAAPTEVRVAMLLVDLSAIDGAEQSVTADLYVVLEWSDVQLADPGGDVRYVALREAWQPPLEMVNQRDVKTARPETLEVRPDGTVLYRQRYSGEFSAPMTLREFPFDRQRIEFHLVTPGLSPDEVRIVVDAQHSGRLESLSIPDWKVGEADVDAVPLSPPGSDRQVAGVVLRVDAERRVEFYVLKAFVSVAIIVAMGWVVFWIPGQYVPPRVSVSVTAMLTLIAYRFLLGSVLPPVPYLTRMDWFLLGSTLLVFIGLVGVVADLHLGEAAARRLDRIMKVAYPAAFVVLTVAVAAV
jgi:hypothetical protein